MGSAPFFACGGAGGASGLRRFSRQGLLLPALGRHLRSLGGAASTGGCGLTGGLSCGGLGGTCIGGLSIPGTCGLLPHLGGILSIGIGSGPTGPPGPPGLISPYLGSSGNGTASLGGSSPGTLGTALSGGLLNHGGNRLPPPALPPPI